MNTETFFLFLACMIFSAFGAYINQKSSGLLNLISYISVIISLSGALYVIATSFITLIKG